MNWTQLWSLLHHKAHEQPLAHPLRPNKQLVLKSIPSQSHLCSIKIAITHNGKRCSAPKLNLEMINEVKNIKKDVGFSLLLYNYNYIRILWTFIGLAKISVYCAVCYSILNTEYAYCLGGSCPKFTLLSFCTPHLLYSVPVTSLRSAWLTLLI